MAQFYGAKTISVHLYFLCAYFSDELYRFAHHCTASIHR